MDAKKITLDEIIQNDYYLSRDGYEMAREHGKTPNGNPMNGRWVLRDGDGIMIDFDQYRNDLIERNNCEIK